LWATTGRPPILSARIAQSSPNVGLLRVLAASMPWIDSRRTAQALARRPVAVSKSIATQSWSLVDATSPSSAAHRSGCAALSPTDTRRPVATDAPGVLKRPPA